MNELLIYIKERIDHNIVKNPGFCLLVYKELDTQEEDFIESLFYLFDGFGEHEEEKLNQFPDFDIKSSLLERLGYIAYLPTATKVNLNFLEYLDIALSSSEIVEPNDMGRIAVESTYQFFIQIPLYKVFSSENDKFKLQEKFEVDINSFALSSSRDQMCELINKMLKYVIEKQEDFKELTNSSAYYKEIISTASVYDINSFVELLVFLLQIEPEKSFAITQTDFQKYAPFLNLFHLLSLLEFKPTRFRTYIISLADDFSFLQYSPAFEASAYNDFAFLEEDDQRQNCLSLESTGRIYCYKNGPKELLSLFCDTIYELPHVTVFEISRDLLKRNKINAILACRFLEENLMSGRVFPDDLANLIASFDDEEEIVCQNVCKLVFDPNDTISSRIMFCSIVDYCKAQNCLLAYPDDDYRRQLKYCEKLKALVKRDRENKRNDIAELLKKLEGHNYVIFKSEYQEEVNAEIERVREGCKDVDTGAE